MAECLLIARRGSQPIHQGRLFAILESQPESAVASELIANMINGAIRSGEIRRLEDISLGGSSIRVGDTSAGQLIDCPLPASGPWTMAGIDDVFLAQSAYHLARGKIALADSRQDDWPVVRITDVGSLADRGPYHRRHKSRHHHRRAARAVPNYFAADHGRFPRIPSFGRTTRSRRGISSSSRTPKGRSRRSHQNTVLILNRRRVGSTVTSVNPLMTG